jgi:hypothetical protein
MLTTEWTKQRWLEFRLGYSTYLVLFIGIANFVLIAYNFIPSLKNVIDFTLFTILVFIIGVPITTYIGRLHVKKQLPVESKISSDINPYREKILEGKEVMNNKWTIWSTTHSIWNNEHAIWNLDYAIWNAELTLKNMKLMNFISERFNAPPELMYRKELEEIEKWVEQSMKWKRDLQTWKKGLETWKQRFESLQRGEAASKIMESESSEIDGVDSGSIKLIEQNKK